MCWFNVSNRMSGNLRTVMLETSLFKVNWFYFGIDSITLGMESDKHFRADLLVILVIISLFCLTQVRQVYVNFTITVESLEPTTTLCTIWGVRCRDMEPDGLLKKDEGIRLIRRGLAVMVHREHFVRQDCGAIWSPTTQFTVLGKITIIIKSTKWHVAYKKGFVLFFITVKHFSKVADD